MRIILLLIVIVFCNCNSSKEFADSKSLLQNNNRLQILSQNKEERIVEQKARIDTILEDLFQTEFSLCHYHNYYNSSHDYTKLHSELLDELVFLHNESITNESYIYQKVLRQIDFKLGTSQEDWYYCILSFTKKDCSEKDNDHRLNQLPYIIRDTSNSSNSLELIKHISIILNEPCERTQNHIRTEVEWRKKLFESLKSQIPHVSKMNIEKTESLEYIYETMAELPDSLTTDFAYNYLMTNELSENFNELPRGIFDILENSIRYEKEYTYFDGSQINLTTDKIKLLKKRLIELNNKINCDWCIDTINILERLQVINKRNI